MRRRAMSLALLAGAAAGAIGWLLVRRDVKTWGEGGFTAGPELGFVVFLSALVAGVVYFVARRVIDGPPLVRDEWTLLRQPGPRPVVRVEELTDRLARRGYQLAFWSIDDAPIPGDSDLIGPRFRVKDPRLRHGRVTLQLGSAWEGTFFGTVEVADTDKRRYDELAQFLIYELGVLIPGIQFKRTQSALSPEETSILETDLPERPRLLPPG